MIEGLRGQASKLEITNKYSHLGTDQGQNFRAKKYRSMNKTGNVPNAIGDRIIKSIFSYHPVQISIQNPNVINTFMHIILARFMLVKCIE